MIFKKLVNLTIKINYMTRAKYRAITIRSTKMLMYLDKVK